MELIEQVRRYLPVNEQEEQDQKHLLEWLESGQEIYTRDNASAHLTASAWVVSPDRKQVLMIYHNLYDSWAWMGGHADGERDLLAVAMREAREESGITEIRPLSTDIFSLEVLSVDGHVKRGKYVSTHLHLNVTYLFEAPQNQALVIKPDENSGVCWFDVEDVPNRTNEPWFRDHIYNKLCQKVVDSGI